jgi:hypothetical protein
MNKSSVEPNIAIEFIRHELMVIVISYMMLSSRVKNAKIPITFEAKIDFSLQFLGIPGIEFKPARFGSA